MTRQTSGGLLAIGSQMLKIKEPVVELAKGGKILIIGPNGAANDHEASSSQVKPRDPKYTQPRWCPTGLTKTQKRKLQRLRNQEKVAEEAERFRDASFNKDRPIIRSQVWVPKPTELITQAPGVPVSALKKDKEPVAVPTITYSSWADEVEAADLAR